MYGQSYAYVFILRRTAQGGLRRSDTELRALVTDVELGGEMSGVELAQFAKRKFPDLNVVMVSGHGPPHVPQDIHFLLKPYEPQQLLDVVLR